MSRDDIRIGRHHMTLMNRTSPRHFSYRSAINGRFVSKAFARRYPSTTMRERRGGGSTHGAYRSCRTGRFVPRDYARRHPRSTLRDR
jgi:hypothetical protein